MSETVQGPDDFPGAVLGAAAETGPEAEPLFEVLEPFQLDSHLVFNSPHSGRNYTADFLAVSRLDERNIRRSEDTFVDELFRPVTQFGAPLLMAHFPRAWLDVNREPYELDPKMFVGELPAFANSRSVRVAGGLGTIARIVAESHEIYTRPLTIEEALARIEGVYMPYHRTLRGLVARAYDAFGTATLIDCHSMPSSVRGVGTRFRPDFVLGDRHGASCSPELTSYVQQFLAGRGYTVCCNKPYAGGFITEHYGRPARNLHALQIEINRGLYLDEIRLTRTAGFEELQRDLTSLVEELTLLPAAGMQRDAAE
jgi:N-formylglutamate amidohydrolase